MGTKRWILVPLAVAALLGVATVAAAQTETTSTPSTAAPEGGKKWHFTIPLGVWPFGVHGPTGANGFETDVDMGIHDVQKMTSRALGFAVEAGRGRITALPMFAFLRFEPDRATATLPNGVVVRGSPRLDWTTAELAVAFRSAVIDPGPKMLVVEPLVGVRYNKMKSNIQLVQPADTTIAEKQVNWTDVFVGVRGVKSFTKHIGVSARGDIGSGGSNHTWNAAASIGYRFIFEGSSLTVAAGYKGQGIDYDSGGKYRFFMDQKMYGPTLGVAYSF